MNPVDKQKMCPHCDARIAFEVEICPYCAQGQEVEKTAAPAQTPLFQNQSLQESLTSLYTPPYSGKRPLFSQSEKQPSSPIKENAMYKNVTEDKFQDPLKAISTAAIDESQQKEGESSLWPTVFMVVASNFFTLGLLQLFFSEAGLLKLEWDGSYWFLYCLFSIPLFYLGIKKMKQL
ncbi:MAG TPA: hypothetical protein VLF61_04715 [Rhabdochlamydiaceae bacterium]|nr:hypothetical protein [Rhabdochlamydiaceae bacterium]